MLNYYWLDDNMHMRRELKCCFQVLFARHVVVDAQCAVNITLDLLCGMQVSQRDMTERPAIASPMGNDDIRAMQVRLSVSIGCPFGRIAQELAGKASLAGIIRLGGLGVAISQVVVGQRVLM
jgi:hypothetical protein